MAIRRTICRISGCAILHFTMKRNNRKIKIRPQSKLVSVTIACALKQHKLKLQTPKT